MAVVEFRGLDSLRRRLSTLGAMAEIGPTLRSQADAVAMTARDELQRRGFADLSRSVRIVDESQGTRQSFAIGTADQAGWHVEFGTTRLRAVPWLGPAFRQALPAVNHALRKIVAGATKAFDRT